MKLHKLILTVLALVAIAVPVFAQPDMRVNVGANAVLFRENGGIQIWTPDETAPGGWSMALRLTAEESAELTEDASEDISTDIEPEDVEATDVVLVSEDEQITIELLNNGQWQVSSGPDFEGKTNVAILESDFTFARQYTWGAFFDTEDEDVVS